MYWGIAAVAAVSVLIGACTMERGAPTGAPTLSLVDSVVLEEPDTAYLGRPATYFLSDSGGALYLADQLTDRVLRYGSDGRLRGVVGRSGGGPGELRQVSGHMAVLGDSLLVVDGYGTRTISLYRLSNWSFVGRRRYEGSLSSLTASGDRLWVGLINRGRRLGIVSVGLSGLIGEPSDATAPIVATMGALPRAYSGLPGMAVYADVRVAGWNDTVLAGFGGIDQFTTALSDGRLLDSFRIPAIRRRGTTGRGLKTLQHEARDAQATEDESTALSALFGIWRLSDGSFLVWHQDARVHMEGRAARISGQGFVSLVSSDRQRACVDARVPQGTEEMTRLTVSRDTVLTLAQELAKDGGARVATIVRRYAIGTDDCQWRPVERLP